MKLVSSSEFRGTFHMRKIDGLEELNRWVLNINDCLCRNQTVIISSQMVEQVRGYATKISNSIRYDFPFYANELPQIVETVFRTLGAGSYGLNPAAFGELFIIIKHLHNDPQDVSVWTMIHPRIVKIAKEEYLDGHYASAANRSFVEVETRLRELFKELKPGVDVPAKVGDLIGALLTQNGAYHFSDTSTQSGEDYRSGIQFLFIGDFKAYRNPSSHENINISREDAFDQIVLASQLMKVLDNNKSVKKELQC